jgi:ABC-2 type transport system permease protein
VLSYSKRKTRAKCPWHKVANDVNVMGKSFAIAAREYNAAVKTKAFVISVVLLPIMLSATFVLRHLTEHLPDSGDKRYVFIDHASDPALFDSLNAAVDKRNKDGAGPPWLLERVEQADPAAKQRYDLSEQIRRGTLAGFIEVNGKEIVYHSNTPAYFEFRDFAGRQINEILRRNRLTAAGFPAAKVEPLLTPLPVKDGGLAKLDAATGAVVNDKAPSAVAAIIVPFALVMLMFLVIVVGAIPMMQGVIEEKQQRIAEVLLASVQPFQLMAGKLIGMTAISMTLIAIYGLGGLWIAGKATFDVSSYVTPSVMAWFLLFQILAVLMFGSMYIAVGASCTDMKEAQALLLPLNLLIMLPLMLLADVIQHPTGPLARWASFFPTAAPMLTIARIAASPAIPFWEKLGPAVITFATTLLFVWAAGRIFRAGLMAGKASLGSMLAWVIRG